jgi:hypothetical protein
MYFIYSTLSTGGFSAACSATGSGGAADGAALTLGAIVIVKVGIGVEVEVDGTNVVVDVDDVGINGVVANVEGALAQRTGPNR